MRKNTPLIVLGLFGVAASAHAQNVSTDVYAAYGLSDSFIVGSDSRGGSDPVGPTDFTALAEYNTDEPGMGEFFTGSVSTQGTAQYGWLQANHSFSFSNAYYSYNVGTSNQSTTDTVTFENSGGVAGSGKFRVKVDFTTSGSAPGSATVQALGISASNLTANTTLLSGEFNFTYGSTADAGLSMFTESEFISFLNFTGSAQRLFGASISFIVTDTGGVSPGDVFATSMSGMTYQVQAVPEPASMVALGLGAVALLRRRKRSG